jgi:hypothetical protein
MRTTKAERRQLEDRVVCFAGCCVVINGAARDSSFVGQPCLLQTFEYHWCIDGVRLEPLDGDLWIKPPRLG